MHIYDNKQLSKTNLVWGGTEKRRKCVIDLKKGNSITVAKPEYLESEHSLTVFSVGKRAQSQMRCFRSRVEVTKNASNRTFFEGFVKQFRKTWGIFIKRESGSLDFIG